MPIIMGTAGHIDHGKTALIRALTGIDCDRLVEEKKRGITIELGFAYLDVESGTRLGIIDVPGHERFVKNMVAGAAGIDFVMLVVAADEGVMPQTREHLEICSLLGIETGVVALNKADLVDDDWIAMVTEDLREHLAGSFLEEAPIIPVSSVTGAGLDALRNEIFQIMESFVPRRRNDLLLLPVDRVFSMRGHGTVVTGTLVSGAAKTGEDVLIYPQQRPAKVRNIQSHGESTESVKAGLRTAVNLQGVETSEVSRGDMIAHPGTLFPSTLWDIELQVLSSSPKALKHRTEIHFHHGAKEVMARLYFHDRSKLEPGDTAVCRIRFEEPIAGVYGDRIVIRSFSPLRTVAGGKVLNPIARKGKKYARQAAELVQAGMDTDKDSAAALVLFHLQSAVAEGVKFAELRVLTPLDSKSMDALMQEMGAKGKAFIFDKEERAYVGGGVVLELEESVVEYMRRFHKKKPLEAGISRGELASGWGKHLHPKLFHFVVERMLKQGLIKGDKQVLKLPEHEVSLAGDEEGLKTELLETYKNAGLTPPNFKDVLNTLNARKEAVLPILKVMQETGEITKIQENMYFSTAALEALKKDVIAYFGSNEEMGPQEFRELTGLSRKFAIPLLEYLDKQKTTIRVGDKRRLRRKN